MGTRRVRADVTLRILSSPDDGATWSELWAYAEDDGDLAAEDLQLPLPAGSAGAEALRISLCAEGSSSATIYHWDVDDICVLPGAVPSLAELAPARLPALGVLELPVQATDPDGDPLTLRLVEAPDFAVLDDHGDGTGTLTLSPGATDEGLHAVVLAVTDGVFTAERTLSVEVFLPGRETLLAEDFATAASFADIGWTEWRAGEPQESNWQLYESYNFVYAQIARFNDEPADTDFVHRLVSPSFDPAAFDEVLVRWRDVVNASSGGPLVLVLSVSPDDGATWHDVWSYAVHEEGSHLVASHDISSGGVLAGASAARLAFTVVGVDTLDLHYWELTEVMVIGVATEEP